MNITRISWSSIDRNPPRVQQSLATYMLFSSVELPVSFIFILELASPLVDSFVPAEALLHFWVTLPGSLLMSSLWCGGGLAVWPGMAWPAL